MKDESIGNFFDVSVVKLMILKKDPVRKYFHFHFHLFVWMDEIMPTRS